MFEWELIGIVSGAIAAACLMFPFLLGLFLRLSKSLLVACFTWREVLNPDTKTLFHIWPFSLWDIPKNSTSCTQDGDWKLLLYRGTAPVLKVTKSNPDRDSGSSGHFAWVLAFAPSFVLLWVWGCLYRAGAPWGNLTKPLWFSCSVLRTASAWNSHNAKGIKKHLCFFPRNIIS